MQYHTKLQLAFALAAALLTSASLAGPGNANLTDYPTRIATKAQAEKLAPATKLAFACTSCKTLKPIEDKKGLLSWFKADEKHDCPGCGGKVTVMQSGAGNGGNVAHSEYTHVCTKCGDKSAYTCAGHKS